MFAIGHTKYHKEGKSIAERIREMISDSTGYQHSFTLERVVTSYSHSLQKNRDS